MMNQNKVIELRGVGKSYNTKTKKVVALDNVNLTLVSGTFYAIMGHSGSGKSTLINILGLIDKHDKGKYFLYNSDIDKLNDDVLSNLRMKNIGFIFQDYCLNQTLKSYENVIIPMLINKNIGKKDRKPKSIRLLTMVGLEKRIDHFPKELSGGEQQRVSIARALANDPDIILADEPTGNLDEKNEKMIFSYLKKIAKEGKCIIVVTHSNEVKNYADKILKIKDGILTEL